MDQTIVVKVPTLALRNNLYNPNQQSIDSFDLLVKSIETDGFTLPVVVNSGESDPALRNMIIDGEHRWRAAQVLEMAEVPVVYKDMDEAQMRASTLRHNKARGHHDVLLESKVLRELAQEVGTDELMEGLNLDAVELDVMLTNANSYTDAEDMAQLTEGEVLEGLAEQGLTGENAKTVAHRHAIIGSKDELAKSDKTTLSNESGQSVRIEFIYSGQDADYMRAFVRKMRSAREAILAILE